MKTSLFLVLMLSLALLIHTASAMVVPWGSLLITVKPENPILQVGQIPVLVGTVTNQGGIPISNAQVSISTSYGIFENYTDNDGKFRYQYASPVAPAQYLINVEAQKSGYGTGHASTTFFVSGVPVSQSPQYDSVTISGNNINQDPLASRILKNIEIAKKQQAEQDAKIRQMEEDRKFQESQQALANQQLQFDLQSWFVQFNPFTPRNAYALFISQINQTVQSIFWGQFNLTEQKTNAGLVAQNQVLQNGGTYDQARNAFIQNAATSRSEISKVNNDLNVKYGNASAEVQAKFDKYGNLPRP